MAANPIPDALSPLFALAEDMADGLHSHETTIGIKQNTEASLRADLAAARVVVDALANAKAAKDTFSSNLRVADSNARSFLKTVRGVLAPRLGESWSATWEPTGFPNQSTAVPASQDERLSLCASLKTYFTANPAFEVPQLNVTAANADTLFTALSDAREAVNNGNTDAGKKKAARDTAVETLKTRMRGLIAELGQLLDDNDPLWEAFGLNEPGASATPDKPEALIVTPGAPGTLLVDWADARRAARYRVWKQVVGVDAKPIAVATVTDSDATLTGLPSGKTVNVTVTAVNDAGESQSSAEATVIMD